MTKRMPVPPSPPKDNRKKEKYKTSKIKSHKVKENLTRSIESFTDKPTTKNK